MLYAVALDRRLLRRDADYVKFVDHTLGDDEHQLAVDTNSTSCIYLEPIEFLRQRSGEGLA